MNKTFFSLFLLAIAGISIAVRLLPHPPNFAPIAALALFAGVYASKISKWYLLAPLAAMLVSDLFIGFYEWKIMAVVYASFFAMGFIGLLVQKYKSATWRIGGITLATLTGSILFYLTTNFAVWAFSGLPGQGLYAPTLDGLLLSYYMAIPFFKFTLLGDLFYVSLFFGSYALITSLNFRYRYKPTAAVYSHSVVEGGLGVMSYKTRVI